MEFEILGGIIPFFITFVQQFIFLSDCHDTAAKGVTRFIHNTWA